MFVLVKELPVTEDRPFRQWHPVAWWLLDAEGFDAAAADSLGDVLADLPDDGTLYRLARLETVRIGRARELADVAAQSPPDGW